MAQRIPQEVIETVRSQTNIVEVIGQYVQLKKSGKNYLGLCPFHEERNHPSLLQKTSRSFIALVAVRAETCLLFFKN